MYNTEDLQEFFITSFKSLGRSTTSLCAVTGTKAKLAKENGIKFSEEIAQLRKGFDDNKDKVFSTDFFFCLKSNRKLPLVMCH